MDMKTNMKTNSMAVRNGRFVEQFIKQINATTNAEEVLSPLLPEGKMVGLSGAGIPSPRNREGPVLLVDDSPKLLRLNERVFLTKPYELEALWEVVAEAVKDNSENSQGQSARSKKEEIRT